VVHLRSIKRRHEQAGKSDWERDTLTEAQISVAAMDSWIARESLKYPPIFITLKPRVE